MLSPGIPGPLIFARPLFPPEAVRKQRLARSVLPVFDLRQASGAAAA
jgi:hypothetical protein